MAHPKPKSSSFEVARKKPVSVTGRYVAPKQSLAAQEDLKAVVSAHRSAVASGGKAKAGPPVSKLDPAVVAGLANIKRFAGRPDKLELVTVEMEKLTAELQPELYKRLPGDLRVLIDTLLGRVKSPPAWAAAVQR